MRGTFFMSLGLHALAGLAMVWASGAHEAMKAMPSVTNVKLIQLRSVPATPGPQSPVVPAGGEQPSPKMQLKDKSKPKPEQDVAANVPPKPQMPKPSPGPKSGIGGDVEVKGPAGTLGVKGSEFGEYNYYLALVQNKIQSNFRPPPGIKTQQLATISFSILKNGQMANFTKMKSSGNLLVDQAAERAIRAAVPFPGLPQEYTQGQLDLYFEFVTNPLAQR
jgi:periplasmic protein TonB